MERDFPGGPVVENLPKNSGGMNSIPGPGRSHMPQSNKPLRSKYWAHVPLACNIEKSTHSNEEQPPLPETQESRCMAKKTQCSQK